MCTCQYDAQASCLCVKTKICNTPAVVCYQDHCVVSAVSGYNKRNGPQYVSCLCVTNSQPFENQRKLSQMRVFGDTWPNQLQQWSEEECRKLRLGVCTVYCVPLHREFNMCRCTEFTVCHCTVYCVPLHRVYCVLLRKQFTVRHGTEFYCVPLHRVYCVSLHRVYCVPRHRVYCVPCMQSCCRTCAISSSYWASHFTTQKVSTT